MGPGDEQREGEVVGDATAEVMKDARADLQRLLNEHADELGELPWIREADRWAELVFCLINAHYCGVPSDPLADDTAELSRAIVDTLSNIGLIEPAELAKAAGPGPEATVLRWVLGRHLYPSDAVDSLIHVLSGAARMTTERYDGKIQRFLRAKGEEIRDEFVAMFDPTHGSTMRQAAALWLQNVANLPIWIDDDTVRPFCESRGYLPTDLEDAADDLGMNLALVDDVVRLETKRGTQVDGEP